MKKIVKNIRKRIKDEAGQALIIVLLLLALGSLIMTPLLSYTGTGLKTGQVYNTKSDEFYAADAGVEDALWLINNDKLEGKTFNSGGAYDPFYYYDYDDKEWLYILSERISGEDVPVQVNGKDVEVIIKNMWIPYGIDAPSPDVARKIIQGWDVDHPAKLIITGKADAPQLVDGKYIGQYEIKITFIPGTVDEQDDLRIQSVGVWLPPGVEYGDGDPGTPDSTFEAVGVDYYSDPGDPITHAGGTAVVWSSFGGESGYPFTGQSSPQLDPFPGVTPGGSATEKCTITFKYTAESEQPPEAVAWVDTSGVYGTYGVDYAWDADVKVYGIVSTANTSETGTSTEIEAYTLKGEMRELVGATSGDYYATGDAFLYAGGSLHDSKYRDTMYSSGDAEVDSVIVLPPEYNYNPLDGIPDNASIVYAYLYWTGWIDNDGYNDPGGTPIWQDPTSSYGTTTTVWSDPTSSYGTTTTVWTENCSSFSDTPSSWPFTWSNGINWTIDAGRFRGRGGGSVADRTLTSNTIPLGGYAGQTLYLSASISDSSAEGGDILYYQFYNASGWSSQQAMYEGNYSSGTYTVTIPGAYLTDQFKVLFYWNTTDTNEYVYLDNITISALSGPWSPGARWTIYNNDEFRGEGGGSTADRTLTRVSSINLSAYAGKTVTISWGQRENGTLSSTDTLYYAYSKDNGATWSANMVAFSDDSPTTPFTSSPIPNEYLTSGFRIRFYWSADNTYGSEYCYIDDITITALSGPWSPGARWTIYNNDEFRGEGGGTANDRTLTRVSSIDLSAYTGQTVTISWSQRENGTLSSTDTLYYAYSKDNGTTWSANTVAFSDDIGSSPVTFTSSPILNEYLTSGFRIRFYWSADNSSGSEYCYIDDIKIVASSGYTGLEYHTGVTTPEEVQTLVHDNARVDTVLFGPNANPTQEVFADNYQIVEPVIMNGAVDEGKSTWSYCCYADVTALVTQWIEDEDLGNNGAGTYTVKNAWVNVPNELDPGYSWNFQGGGSTGYPLGTPANTTSNLKDQNCHSGWSLILIYSSPQTRGHQLYLYDINSSGFKYTQGRGSPSSPYDLDFDADGLPGGTIKGFLVPEPIAGETEAGRATVFIGEGDEGSHSEWGDDYFAVNSTKLWDGINCTNNSATNPNDAWNSKSYGLNLDGVDIDTFKITWASGILGPSDTEANVDVVTSYDGIHIIYIILSFRSKITTGGTITFLIN